MDDATVEEVEASHSNYDSGASWQENLERLFAYLEASANDGLGVSIDAAQTDMLWRYIVGAAAQTTQLVGYVADLEKRLKGQHNLWIPGKQ